MFPACRSEIYIHMATSGGLLQNQAVTQAKKTNHTKNNDNRQEEKAWKIEKKRHKRYPFRVVVMLAREVLPSREIIQQGTNA